MSQLLSSPAPSFVNGVAIVDEDEVPMSPFPQLDDQKVFMTPPLVGESESIHEDLNKLSGFASTMSVHSSLSGGIYHSSPSNSGSASTRSLGHVKESASRTASTIFSMRSASGKSDNKTELKRLKVQCKKFASRHNAGKVGILRLYLLPFLRKQQLGGIIPAPNELSLAHNVFSIWWEKLLEVLKSNFQHINGVDRDAFYEAISSIMSRPEWLDYQMQSPYQTLLSHTSNYILMKCDAMRSLPASFAAFAGKVLAYAYNFLPGFAHHILGTLPISQSALRRLTSHRCPLNVKTPCFASIPPHLRSLIGMSVPVSQSGTNFEYVRTESSDSDNSRPESPDFENSSPGSSNSENSGSNNGHIEHINGNHSNSRRRSSPRSQTERSGWERHFTLDSSMFASFLKRFCVLQSQLLPVDHRFDSETEEHDGTDAMAAFWENILLAAPGMLLILAAVVTKLDSVSNELCRQIGPRNTSPYAFKHGSGSSSPCSSGSPSSPSSPLGGVPNRVDQLKLFSVIRDLLHSDDNTVPFFLAFSRVFDRVFRAVAIYTQVYDMKRCITVCDLVEEWFLSVLSVNTTKALETLGMFRPLVVDWQFWQSVNERMLLGDNCHTTIRAISFLFNVWHQIPFGEVLNSFTAWILSEPIWSALFCHWSPLVRSYYQRFLCYRIAAVDPEGEVSWYLGVDLSQYLLESRRLLLERLMDTYLWCQSLGMQTGMKPEMNPSLPMPRMRVGIRLLPQGQPEKPEMNLARVYPFDVYDSIAYLQTDVVGEQSPLMEPVDFDQRFGGSPRLASTLIQRPFSSMQTKVETSPGKNLRRCSESSPKDGLRTESSQRSPTQVRMPEIPERDTTGSPASPESPASPKPQLRFETSSPNASSSATVSNANKSPPPRSSSAVSFFRKLLPKSMTESAEAPSLAEAVVEPPVPEPIKLTPKPHKMRTTGLSPPPQLSELRIDVVKAPFRFVMVPTAMRPPARSNLALPRLPFMKEVAASLFQNKRGGRDTKKNLAIWNYGGRSLAEWSIEIICFERFATDQRPLVNATLEMFPMPHMIAEVQNYFG